ncbi:MAG TPA: hypothetical protein VFK51_05120 [Burkholderiales bacterium]|jgi:hypothetical protein|nr:hypothetical protein [Burkholderiales bacterium]
MNGQDADLNAVGKHDADSMSEAEIDQALEDTFPASDPPFWTLGEPETKSALRQPDTVALSKERDRIEFLVDRDGLAIAVTWVRRTMRLYREAVLDRTGFARTDLYRRGFIQSYCDFKRWLGRIDANESPSRGTWK